MNLLLAAALLAVQDTSLEEILKKMESRAAGVRDISYRVAASGGRDMLMARGVTSEGTVTHVRGAGIRMRITPTVPEFPGMPAFMRGGLGGDYIFIPDAYLFFQKTGSLQELGSPLVCQASRISLDDLRKSGQDIFFLPSNVLMLGLRFSLEEPLAYYALEPKLFFGLEDNLTVSGKRDVEGRTYHVLTSRRDAPSAPPTLPFSLLVTEREFLIDAETLTLDQMQWRLTVKSSIGRGRDRDEQGIITMRVKDRKEVVDGFSLPVSSAWMFSSSRSQRVEQTITHTLKEIRVNSGLKPSEILDETSRNDLFTDMIPAKTEVYEERIRKNPDDAEAHYNLAFVKGSIDTARLMELGMMGGGDKPAFDMEAITRSLERAHELRPQAEGPVLNLLSAYKLAENKEKELAFLGRIEDGTLKGSRLVALAAGRLNDLGEFARARKMLDQLANESPAGSPLVLEHLVTAAGLGDEKPFLDLLAVETGRCSDSTAKIRLFESFTKRIENLSEEAQARFAPEKAAAMYERGLKERPGETAFLLGRAAALERGKKPAEAVLGLLQGAPKDEALVRHALGLLDDTPDTSAEMIRIMRPGREEEPPPTVWSDLKPELAGRLVKALEGVDVEDPRRPYFTGLALAAAGRKEEAWKKYEAALEACAAAEKDPSQRDTAFKVAYRLGSEEGPEGWLERCVKIILSILPEDTFTAQIYFSREKENPFARMAALLVEKREWLKLYEMASTFQKKSSRGFSMVYYSLREKLPKGDDLEACLKTIRESVFTSKKQEDYTRFADFLTAVNERRRVPEVLEKARTLAPDDLELAKRLAQSYRQTSNHEKAVSVYGEIIPKLEGPERVTTILELASVHLSSGFKEDARKTLGEINAEKLSRQDLALRMARLCKTAEGWDLGIKACKRAFDLEAKPNFLMGRFLEKKEDFYEAIRYYNRAISVGSTDMAYGMESIDVVEAPVPVPPGGKTPNREPRNAKEAKEWLLKKVGEDFLLERHLKRKFKPLSEKEERDAKRAIKNLSSDMIDEREEACETLKEIGQKATPLLKPLLDSDDAEIKTRVRGLMAAWAEPK
jgi:tetratricopeptide (TPR) repeat protein